MSVLVIDKPTGCTSFDVIRRVKKSLAVVLGRERLRALKIGHGGTLDPMASGVLPVCLGEGTKLAQFLLDADKEYEATLRLGTETDTLDAEGRVTAEAPVPDLRPEVIEAALARFRGPISQVPPMYSALKRDGRPLHEYARAGEEVERTPRQVVIHELALTAFDPPATLSFRVRCTKGTYVRTLAADLARALGTCGHLIALRRTRSGPFGLDEALSLDALDGRLARQETVALVPPAQALAHLPALTAEPAVAESIRQGKKLPWSSVDPDGSTTAASALVRILRPDGSLLAVADRAAPVVRTLRVFNADGPLPEPSKGAESSHSSAFFPIMRG